MNLYEVAGLAWQQLNPVPSDEAAITLEEFETTAKAEYALQMWIKARNAKREDGYFDVPSEILVAKEFEVDNGEMNLTGVEILRAIPNEKWIQNVGGLNCICEYIKSTINNWQLLCDDDSIDDAARIFYVVGDKIRFPKGVHKTPLEITFASSGEDINGEVPITDDIAGIIRTRLIEIYAGKTAPEDTTNNTSSNT